MAQLDFISSLHQATSRNYLLRVTEHDKAECAEVAKRFDRDYFDGDRRYGYGGYRYDGRWVTFAQRLVAHYRLQPEQKVLDIGCGKGFLVHDFRKVLPGLEAFGLDVSAYAIENSMPEVREFLRQGDAVQLPYPDKYFDLVVSINTLHNLQLPGLWSALKEIERVGKDNKFVVMDSYRNEREKMNLLYWQITCESIFAPEEWEFLFKLIGYSGDYDLIVFP